MSEILNPSGAVFFVPDLTLNSLFFNITTGTD